MKKQFQSKSVPRGTRTIWRYLGALFLLFTFAIGNVWAAETVLFSSFANTTTSNYFKDYKVDGKTVSVAASSNISSSSGDYYCGAMGSTPSNNNANYVELTVSGATIKTVSVLITGNGSNKTCQPALLGWEGAIASNTTADYVLVPASQVISNKGLSNAQWHQFDVHGNDLTKVRIYRAVKGVSVAGAAAQTYGNAQTLQFYGIRVELETASDKYTVKYKDGDNVLGTEQVNVGSKPTATSINKDKAFYTFEAWQLSGVDKALTDDSWASVAKDAEVTLTARYSGPTGYSSSATLISADVVSNKPNVNTVFAASNIVSSITFDSKNYEFTSNETKPGYYGYKDKASGDYMKIMLKQGKRAQVLFGNLGADPTITVNGVAKSLDATRKTDDMAENTFTWTASAEDALISITMGSGTSTLKKVDIIDLYTATRVDGKSDGAGTDANVLETTLPTPTAISGWTFTGWVANADVKAGEDTKTAGTVLAAGTYTLLANTTFTAQWTEASSTYDITYSSAHGTAPAAENAASVVLAELDAEGWAHKGWTANVDVTVDAATVEAGTLIANGKTVILGGDVTFTAVWKEIFTVTFDAKGGSSVDPVDVEDGATLDAAPSDPTKDDYIFLGWSETDGGAVVADITALTITDDKTFYAKWKLDVQVSEIVFSNSFKGWIHDSQVEVFYMEGESVPTITSYAGKNLKAEGGVVISGDKIIATGTDDSEIEFALTMTEVTPLSATGTQTFEGTEGYVKTRHEWTDGRKWKMSRYAEDGRVAKGETSMYIFLGAAESVTLDWGAQKVTNDVAVYVNGTFVKNIGKNNNSAIPLTGGKNMVALYSLQTSGDIWLNGLTVAPWVSVETVTLKEGEDAISSKEIWESTSFTLTAEVTPDNASNKTITWTSSNEAVATVENGVVTGVAASADPVTITASTVDGVKATCVVTVTTAPEPSANPVITAQPQSADYYEGATIAELKVLATGESLTYQWYLGSEAIEGAIAATYQPTVSAIGSYVYHCVVTNTETGNLPTSLATDNATITISEDPACKAIGYGSTRALATNTEVVIDATTGFKHISSVESCETGKKISGETNLTTVKLGGSSAYYDIYTTEMNIGSIALSLTSSSNGEDKRYKYAVIFCKSAEFDASKILGVVEQVGGAGDDAQVINTPEVPLGTKLVRIMRQYTYKETTYGQGNSSYIYYIRACLVEPAQEVSATVLAQPKDTAYCPTEVVEPLSYELSIEDGASAAYQWYKGTEAIENEEAATYTPSETGVYTCKVTLTKTGRLPKEMTSDEATVTFYIATAITGHVDAVGLVDAEKTISITAEGTSLTYKWQACDVNGTVTDATVLGTAASLNITIASETKYYLATVTGTCGTETQVVEARMWAHHDPAHVTATTTWDWTNAAWNGVTANIEFANTSVEELMANVSADVPCLDGENGFRSDMLYGTGQYVYRPGNKFFQGFKVRFIADVPGIVKVTYRGTGDSKNIILHINDSTYAQYKGGFKTVEALVPAGEVLIEGVGGTDNAGGMTRIRKIEFIADLSGYALADADKTRAVTEGRFGTICMPKGGKVVNGAIFEIAYMDYKDSKPYKIYFDEVVNGLMEPGMPYIFLPNEGAETLGIVSTANKVDDTGHFHGLYGSFTQELLAQNAGNYILQNNQYYYVNSADVYVGANRAYIKLAEVPSYDPGQPAYGRRRVSMNVNAEQVVTDIDNLNAGEQPIKMMIDGKLYILRGEKMFDATGRLVK